MSISLFGQQNRTANQVGNVAGNAFDVDRLAAIVAVKELKRSLRALEPQTFPALLAFNFSEHFSE